MLRPRYGIFYRLGRIARMISPQFLFGGECARDEVATAKSATRVELNDCWNRGAEGAHERGAESVGRRASACRWRFLLMDRSRWLILPGLAISMAVIVPCIDMRAHAQPVGRQECKWIWDCTKGRCKHTPQCANNYDLIPPEPQELPPLVPIDSGASIVPDILPAAGSHCPPKRTCDQDGKCVWEVKC